MLHASVVIQAGNGYAFLGKSGTGKSTHSQLWLRYLEGYELLNDDHPIIRLVNDEVIIYGSPWSGKTPCYKNKQARLKAVVRLEQASENKIIRLRGIQAYAAFSPSCSGMRWQREMADAIHQTIVAVTEHCRLLHLKCLPDEEAAVCVVKPYMRDKRCSERNRTSCFVEGIRELLAEGVPVVFKAKGNSMLPFIRGGQDEVYLVRPTAVSEGDILLCEVSKRQYVLHRLIRQKGDCLILMGDGNLYGTESCNREDVIGKVVKIIRSGKVIDCRNRSYRWASAFWVRLLPLRRVLLKIYRIVS